MGRFVLDFVLWLCLSWSWAGVYCFVFDYMFMRIFGIFASILVAMYYFSFGSAFAKDEHDILVIDIERIATESLAGKDMKAKIEKKQTKIQSQIETKKTELTKKAQKLQESKAKISQADFEEKANNLQNEIMILDSKFQEDIEELQKKQQSASQKIVDKVKMIAKNIALKKESSMVIASNSAFYIDSKSDITDEVIKSLDKEMKTIDIE